MARTCRHDKSRHRPKGLLPATARAWTCIHCRLCRQGCMDVQRNDVIVLAGRGFGLKVAFDAAQSVRESSCVAGGKCVRACPTGALRPHGAVTCPCPAPGHPVRARLRTHK
ncbi:MAG TPA: hypothetical protein ENK15_02785 [Thermopetrobacter sp.]|nr:hypothetical protein [Thermopetrobacter sp.]